MKQSILFLLFAFVGSVAQTKPHGLAVSGEEAERHWRQKQELGELYARIAASRVVIIGTVSASDAIRERNKPPSMDDEPAGQLYTIASNQVLCRQEDLNSGNAGPAPDLETEFHMFVPTRPYVEGIQDKERLIVGRRYLLFLVIPQQKQQKAWADSFSLDPHITYYRGEELSRGVIPFVEATSSNPNPEQLTVFDKVTRLCTAMRPATTEEKLTELNKLAASDDPILRREAQLAMGDIRNRRK